MTALRRFFLFCLMALSYAKHGNFGTQLAAINILYRACECQHINVDMCRSWVTRTKKIMKFESKSSNRRHNRYRKHRFFTKVRWMDHHFYQPSFLLWLLCKIRNILKSKAGLVTFVRIFFFFYILFPSLLSAWIFYYYYYYCYYCCCCYHHHHHHHHHYYWRAGIAQ